MPRYAAGHGAWPEKHGSRGRAKEGPSTPDLISSAKPGNTEARQLQPECRSARVANAAAVTGNGAPHAREM